jgi:Raf kinase inhibitor-like YbhB/YbcL family protein
MTRSFVTTFLFIFLFGGEAMAFRIESSAFQAKSTIPQKYTCDGEDLSPPLAWNDPPAGTKSFALISDDPDAPMGTWVHWVIWNIPSGVRALEEGVPKSETLANSAQQGVTDFRRVGYGGPCPPPGGAHRYFFKLYALDTLLQLSSKAKKADLLAAMNGHILAQAEWMGLYQRSG